MIHSKDLLSQCFEVKRSVGAIIYLKDKYLIQKRDKKKKIYFPQLYGVFGGGVNLKEKSLEAIKREILEELELKINLDQIKYFLNVSINSRHFRNKRSRSYFAVKITKKQFSSINLKEGQSFHLLKIQNVKKLNFVPWDLSAILYFDGYIKKKKSVRPK